MPLSLFQFSQVYPISTAMARTNQDPIDIYANITGASTSEALHKLQEYGGDLNEAVNAYFGEPNRHNTGAPQQYAYTDMENGTQVRSHQSRLPILSAVRSFNPYSLLDSIYRRSFLNGITAPFTSRPPPSSQPGEVMGIPVDFGYSNGNPGGSPGVMPSINYAARNVPPHGLQVNQRIMIDNEERRNYSSASNNLRPYAADTEEHLIQATIEASKREAEGGFQNREFSASNVLSQREYDIEDDEFARALSLSLKSSEDEKAMHERLKLENSSQYDLAKDVEEPLVRPRPNCDVGYFQHQQSGGASEWGGISSQEHGEALILEAAYFGEFHGHAATQIGVDGSAVPNTLSVEQPHLSSLTADRLLREQQDAEYIASLIADREKVNKAAQKTEVFCKNEGSSSHKVLEEEGLERKLAAKEASLSQEPASDDENTVVLRVRMPDGNHFCRRFLKCDKLQSFFDFIDVRRAVKPGTYRVVRPYPRRAFSDAERLSTLAELGLTNKQETLFLELI